MIRSIYKEVRNSYDSWHSYRILTMICSKEQFAHLRSVGIIGAFYDSRLPPGVYKKLIMSDYAIAVCEETQMVKVCKNRHGYSTVAFTYLKSIFRTGAGITIKGDSNRTLRISDNDFARLLLKG